MIERATRGVEQNGRQVAAQKDAQRHVGAAPPLGLMVSSKGSAPEKVELRAFAGNLVAAAELFVGKRLDRAWSAEDQRGIARLLALVAATEAVRELGPLVAARGGGRSLGEEEVEDLLQRLASPLERVELTNDVASEVMAREVRAIETLARALLDPVAA